ncbi:hypothetical protein H4R18_000836 [Coemansia javaensis]|uniref:Protein kinase domain-containing protein n=1 Tax=Coemansia javaensis TaxID=2761396 RepID=A0A9W8HFK2_9FUNG|nr:hypothetical protein H4R18_000836 [Coemansia javaensis]
MDGGEQALRLHDYTVLATLGLSALYGGIAARLESERGHAPDDPAAPHMLGTPRSGHHTPRGRRSAHAQLHDPARKRKGAADSGTASALVSPRAQSPRSPSMQPGASPALKRARGSAGPRGRRPSGAPGAMLKSAFARVRHDSSLCAENDLDGAEGHARRGRARTARGDSVAPGAAAAAAGAADMRPREYGEVWFDRYLILAKLGEGAFSHVFLAADMFCARMGKKHDGTRLVTIKRMGAREGAIGISEYQTLAVLNRLDPKDRVHIVRMHGIFLHAPQPCSPVGYDPTLRRLVPAQHALPAGRRAGEPDTGRYARRHQRRLAERARLREFGGGDESPGRPAEPDALMSSTSAVSSVDDCSVCLVMEPLLGSTLHDAFPRRTGAVYAAYDEVVAKQMHMDMVRTVVRQLLVALEHMHGNALIHADIKTTNIICVSDADMRIKLIDFGNAVGDSDVCEYYSSFEIQTVWFRAPEVAYQRPFGRAIDLWSVGCVMCELWLGRSLFTDMDNHSLIRSILKLRGPPPAQLYSASPVYAEVVQSWGTRPTPGFAPAAVGGRHKGLLHPELSMDWEPQLRMQWLKHSLRVQDDDFVSLADALLEYDPEERPTAAEALKHPFFRGMYAY